MEWLFFIFHSCTNLHVVHTLFSNFFALLGHLGMYGTTPKRIFTEAKVDRSRNKEAQTVISRRHVGSGRRWGRICGRGRMSTVSMSASISGRG